MNITKLTEIRVKGTFYFAAAKILDGGNITITEGTFDAEIAETE